MAYVVQYILCLKLLMPGRAMLLNNKEITNNHKNERLSYFSFPRWNAQAHFSYSTLRRKHASCNSCVTLPYLPNLNLCSNKSMWMHRNKAAGMSGYTNHTSYRNRAVNVGSLVLVWMRKCIRSPSELSISTLASRILMYVEDTWRYFINCRKRRNIYWQTWLISLDRLFSKFSSCKHSTHTK